MISSQENLMRDKLTRRGARGVTSTLDRLASLIQENPSVLGVDPRIAQDFAHRCDMISDAVERTASANYPLKSAGELPDALKKHQFEKKDDKKSDDKKDEDKKDDESKKKAGTNEEGLSLPNDGWDADQIADQVPGPLESESDESYMSTFKEEEHHELGELEDRGALGKAASGTHGFNLFG
jgi:hypothetical protein